MRGLGRRSSQLGEDGQKKGENGSQVATISLEEPTNPRGEPTTAVKTQIAVESKRHRHGEAQKTKSCILDQKRKKKETLRVGGKKRDMNTCATKELGVRRKTLKACPATWVAIDQRNWWTRKNIKNARGNPKTRRRGVCNNQKKNDTPLLRPTAHGKREKKREGCLLLELPRANTTSRGSVTMWKTKVACAAVIVNGEPGGEFQIHPKGKDKSIKKRRKNFVW